MLSLVGILDYIKQLLRAAKRDCEYGCNVKCPKCNQWMHNRSVKPHVNAIDREAGIYAYTCDSCGKESTWDFGSAPVPLFLD